MLSLITYEWATSPDLLAAEFAKPRGILSLRETATKNPPDRSGGFFISRG